MVEVRHATLYETLDITICARSVLFFGIVVQYLLYFEV